MASVSILAYGAASALGVGRSAFDVGAAGQVPRSRLAARASGRYFGRVEACLSQPAERPRALFELGLAELAAWLDTREPGWRSRKLGVVIGTSSGGMAALERALPDGDGSPAWASSAYFAPLVGLSQILGREPERTVALYAACASATLALGLAMRWLELERYELVIAGGYDAESEWVSAGFDALKATSRGLPRPFRAERDGMVLGEGVGLMALGLGGAKPFGFLRGFGATTDAVHITAPDRSGSELGRAAKLALHDAGIGPERVDFVSAHGTATSFNDAAEAQALAGVLGARSTQVPLHAFKPSVGHTLGAAGALEALAACSAFARGVLPASLSAGTPMPEFGARLLERNLAHPSDHCLKLSTAFGGANAALVLSRHRGHARVRAGRGAYLVSSGRFVSRLELERVRPFLLAPVERLPRSDELSLLSVAAAAEALHELTARGLVLDPERTGVIVGSVGATLEADAEFAARVLARGPEQAEPRRFPGTSPNACAGHVAIAFGLRGPSHSVGAGANAALEAVEVALDWLAAGDADAFVVVAAEHAGVTSARALGAAQIGAPTSGGMALVLSTSAGGPELSASLLVSARDQGRARAGGRAPFMALAALCAAAGLPAPDGFGTVRLPE